MRIEEKKSKDKKNLFFPSVVNFLHYGNSLEYFLGSNLCEFPYIMASYPEINSYLSKKNRIKKYASENLKNYKSNKTKINIKQINSDIKKSITLKQIFNQLGCRGFSYKIRTEFEFIDKLQDRINLRLMLVASEDLFYPPRVRKFLRRMNNVHYKIDGFPAIGFALGLKEFKYWYIFTLQSDLLYRTSYIRDHFRGWEKILFCILIGRARTEGATIFLPRSCDILLSCYPTEFTPDSVPLSWKQIYDYTANYFGMKLRDLSEPVDSQVFDSGPPAFLKSFYCLETKPTDKV